MTPVKLIRPVISEQRLEAALRFLAESDEPAAEMKANVARREFLAKRVRARIFLTSEGSVEARKALAEVSNDVGDAETLLYDAIVAFEKIRAKRQTEELVIETWRSINANRRVGNV